ncbi:hypothetical protein MIND_00303100 [Mycena indigotica]|uniref:Small ribosomal subunit protein mS29 n=1 Tax=Mycena indigotica TaxID=2126181 RepID=A0A8H6T0A8_9AGAR|nr:uncharacterized protein MIND_00303100 [Mycena indigotica]KAF7309328.1 hypothetical protein MIND_00303100 [Mycena indigotica]
MFLLGRGGGRLGAVGRAVPGLGVRHRSNKQRIAPKEKKAAVERDASGRPIVAPRERSLGMYKAMGAGALKHPLFETTEEPGRVELDVPPLHPRMLAPGVATRFHDGPTAPLRVYGLPKHMLLEFRILGAPVAVTTGATLSIVRALEEAKAYPARLVLNGRPGCGKSFLLLQAVQYAHAAGDWVVIYIPRTRTFVDSSTPYSYSLATRTYLQPRAARATLSRIGRANAHHLEHLSTTQEVTLVDGGAAFPIGTPLQTLIDAAAADEALAPAALDAVMAALGGQTLFPVLLAIDDFQTLAGGSAYRDPQFRMIRPHHLGLPRLLLEYASGKRKLARGMVLGALSRSDNNFPVSDQLADALRLPAHYAPSPRAARIRKSRQLAGYLEHQVPLEAYIPEEDALDHEEEDGIPLQNLLDAAEPEDAAELPWTGWNVYDPPVYEDTLVPTHHDPAPAPRPAELWRALVVPKDGASVPATAPDADAEAEAEPESGPAPTPTPTRGKPRAPLVPALRAVRVPDALSPREAAGLFELWLDAGVLRTGGQRRATRRTDLVALAGYRAGADADAAEAPGMEGEDGELDAEEYDPVAAGEAGDVADAVEGYHLAAAEAAAAGGEGAGPAAQLARAEAATLVARIREGQAALAGAAMKGVRTLEGVVEVQARAREAAGWEAGVRSLDEERRGQVAVEMGLVDEEEEGSDEEVSEDEEGEEEESMAAPAPADPALDAFAAEFVAEVAGLSDPADADADPSSSSDPSLDLGDPQLANIVSTGLRGAFADPAAVGGLLRAPASNAVRVEPEAGADSLFLAKYAESSGNARGFVRGLVGTLGTSAWGR